MGFFFREVWLFFASAVFLLDIADGKWWFQKKNEDRFFFLKKKKTEDRFMEKNADCLLLLASLEYLCSLRSPVFFNRQNKTMCRRGCLCSALYPVFFLRQF